MLEWTGSMKRNYRSPRIRRERSWSWGSHIRGGVWNRAFLSFHIGIKRVWYWSVHTSPPYPVLLNDYRLGPYWDAWWKYERNLIVRYVCFIWPLIHLVSERLVMHRRLMNSLELSAAGACRALGLNTGALLDFMFSYFVLWSRPYLWWWSPGNLAQSKPLAATFICNYSLSSSRIGTFFIPLYSSILA